MQRLAAITLWIVLGALAVPALGGRGSEKAQVRREEADRLVGQILAGQGVQAAVSRLLYLGEQRYATTQIMEEMKRSDEVSFRINVAAALGGLGVKQSEPALLDLLEDRDPAVRMTALQGLGRIKSQSINQFQRYLRDKNMGVRREAARALGASGKAALSRALIEAARQEGEPEVRAVMLLAAGEAGDKKQARALEPFLKSTSESTRVAAGRALCRLGAPAGFAYARKLLGSDDRFERRQGLALFEGAKARDVEKVVRPMLKDKEPTVSATAARILYQGGDEKMLEWLVVSSYRASSDAKLAYETELETLHLADDQRKKILVRSGALK